MDDIRTGVEKFRAMPRVVKKCMLKGLEYKPMDFSRVLPECDDMGVKRIIIEKVM